MTYELIDESFTYKMGNIANTYMLCINENLFLKHGTPVHSLYIINEGFSYEETLKLARMTNEEIDQHVRNVMSQKEASERPTHLFWKSSGLTDGTHLYKFYKTRETYDRNMTLAPIKYKGVIRIAQIHPKPSNTILFNYFVCTNNDKKICDLLNRYNVL